MTPRKIDPARVFAGLQPGQLAELAGAAYARRREHDLARALSSPPHAQAADLAPATVRPRRRARQAAGLAAAGLALAAAVALALVAPSGPGSQSSPDSPPAGQRQAAGAEEEAPPSEARNARTLLLLSAERVAQAPDATGRYWYTRERRADLTVVTAGVPTGAKEPAPQGPPPAPGAAEAACAGAEFDDEHAATLVHVHTVETWAAVNPRDPSRTVSNQNPEVVFPTPADQDKWRRLGAKELPWPSASQVETPEEPTVRVGDGERRMTLDQVRALPTTAAELEVELRRLFEERRRELSAILGRAPERFEFPSYVWNAAGALLPGPTTPGTRAAFFEVLAGQQGDIRMAGKVKDPLGRDGVAFAWPNRDPETGEVTSEARLIIDPDSGRLLTLDTVWKPGATVAYTCEVRGQMVTRHRIQAGSAQPIGWTAYEASGWVDDLGSRP